MSPPPNASRAAAQYDPLASDERRLVRLNQQLADAERTQDRAYFQRVLSADLEFRRADESVVNKKLFIEQLADRAYEYVEPPDIRATVLGTLAVVTLVVRAAGTAGGEPFRGVYRNIRLFRRAMTDHGWELERWYSARIESPAVPPSPNETYERILGKPNAGDDTGLRWHTLNQLYGVVWNRGILTDRDRRLITLAVLAAQGATEQFQDHLHGARVAGLSREELLETAIQVAHYGGWAMGTAAQKLILREFEEATMKSVDLERKLEQGLVQAIFAPCARALMDYLVDLRPLARILDVGCGSGIAVRVAKQRFASITAAHGLDYSANAITVANEVATGREFRFWEDNAETFTTGEAYDAILCQHTIQHVTGQADAMGRMRDALRPDGVLVLAAWPEIDDCPAYDFLYTVAGERSDPDGKPSKKVRKLATPIGLLAELAEKAGFADVKGRRLDVASEPIVPERFLRQYLESSAGWQGKRWPEPTRAELYEHAERLGWSEGAPTLRIGMNVVVARRP